MKNDRQNGNFKKSVGRNIKDQLNALLLNFLVQEKNRKKNQTHKKEKKLCISFKNVLEVLVFNTVLLFNIFYMNNYQTFKLEKDKLFQF